MASTLGPLTPHQFIPRLAAQHSTAQQASSGTSEPCAGEVQGHTLAQPCHTHLVSVEATTNDIPTAKDINANIDVILAWASQSLRALQLLLLPVVVGEQPVTGIKEYPGDKGQSGRVTHDLTKGCEGCA